MLELLGGIVIGGVAGITLKDKLLGAQGQNKNYYCPLNFWGKIQI